MQQPVLVTGADGFVGRHLRTLLASEGARVVAWRRPPDPARSAHAGRSDEDEPVETVWQQVDVLDREGVLGAVRTIRPSAVYHCAGAAHVGGSWNRTPATLQINALGTHHLLEAIRLAGLDTRILIPGSAMVYRETRDTIVEAHPVGPSSPYGLSKLAQELLGTQAVSHDGLAVLITRSFNHLGPGQDRSYAASGFAEQIARIETAGAEPVIRTGNLDARRDLTDVRDTVRAYRMIVGSGRPGRIYNVCSGRAYPIREVLERLLAHARVEIGVVTDPARWRPQDNPVLLGDPARLKDELGWTPTIPLDRTLGDLLDYWRRRLRAERE